MIRPVRPSLGQMFTSLPQWAFCSPCASSGVPRFDPSTVTCVSRHHLPACQSTRARGAALDLALVRLEVCLTKKTPERTRFRGKRRKKGERKRKRRLSHFDPKLERGTCRHLYFQTRLGLCICRSDRSQSLERDAS